MIPDNDFICSHEVPGPTKEEIRCLIICKSDVSSHDVVVDLGCGTGGLTLEFARRAKKVYAVDKHMEAINLTLSNLKKHKMEHKVEMIHEEGLQSLKDIPPYDILMIGGSGGDLPLILEEGYQKLKKNGRIIITSILLETPVEAMKTMQKLKMVPEVVNVSVSKGKILDRGTMILAHNPITILTAKK